LCAQILAGVLYGSDLNEWSYVTKGKITAIKHQQLMLYVTHTRLLYLMLKHLLAQKVLYVNVTQISLYLAQTKLMLYQLMLKIAKHQSLNLQEMSLLSYLYSQLSARQ
jgi:hypothetical protein